MNSSPIDTMVGHALGRGGGSDSFRDTIGDNIDGPMGTHIGNGQGTRADATSEYNQVSMTDIQMNLNVIDATRGYGTDSGIVSHDSMFSDSIQTSSHVSNSLSMEPASHNMSNSGNSLYDVPPTMGSVDHGSIHGVNSGNNLGSVYDVNSNNNHASVHNMGGSAHNVGGVPVAGGVPGERQEFVKIEGNIATPVPKASRINIALKKDVNIMSMVPQNDDAVAVASAIGTASAVITSALKAPEEEEESETSKEETQKVGIDRSSGAASLRPFESPSKDNYQSAIKERDTSKKDKLEDRLLRMSNDDFVSLVKNVGLENEDMSATQKIKHACKLKILGKEATRRFQKES